MNFDLGVAEPDTDDPATPVLSGHFDTTIPTSPGAVDSVDRGGDGEGQPAPRAGIGRRGRQRSVAHSTRVSSSSPSEGMERSSTLMLTSTTSRPVMPSICSMTLLRMASAVSTMLWP